MRITVELEDELVEMAQRITGVNQPSVLIHQALRALIERETPRRMTEERGTEADSPERRWPPDVHKPE